MAREISIEAMLDALRGVNYPGYATDVVSLGIIEGIQPLESGGGFAVIVRQPSEREEVMRELASAIHQALTHQLGVGRIELRVRRLEAELGEKTGRVRLDGTRYVVAVLSGKGGVGKSTVAANLALALRRLGMTVGLLDADIYGPSVPMMFGVGDERPRAAGGQHFYPVERYGVKLISIGFFLTEKSPVIWRGPMVMGAIRQFLKDTLWGTQDFLIVDLPPGTGDAQLTLAQLVALDGAVLVTTPQDVALADATRAARMMRQLHCPILGVVENMSYFVCPDCGERDPLFGEGGGAKLAAAEGTEVLAQIPIQPEVRAAGDAGMPIVMSHPEHPASLAVMELARRVLAAMPKD
ncbi:MAG TPA: Mrp/NBP35 family ATP-binding protein [Candidatus Binataceae bacterium]|nr:Mrp/NBP35 family ATP-binding protein [Candidatus Binataceae bacterium]